MSNVVLMLHETVHQFPIHRQYLPGSVLVYTTSFKVNKKQSLHLTLITNDVSFMKDFIAIGV